MASAIVGYFSDDELKSTTERHIAEIGDLLNAPSDLLYVSAKHLRQPTLLRQKSVKNLLDAIDASRQRPLASVLAALGIRHVGAEVAELLARSFGTIHALMEADEERLTAIPSIGPRIAESIASYFGNDGNRNVVEKLRSAGVRLEDEQREVPTEQPFAGMRFVVTGRLEQFSRSQIQDKIKILGGAVSGSVSKKTDYLVAGEDAGSKLADAERLGVAILSEAEMLAKIASGADENGG